MQINVFMLVTITPLRRLHDCNQLYSLALFWCWVVAHLHMLHFICLGIMFMLIHIFPKFEINMFQDGQRRVLFESRWWICILKFILVNASKQKHEKLDQLKSGKKCLYPPFLKSCTSIYTCIFLFFLFFIFYFLFFIFFHLINFPII